jgi:hypothetical protein
MWSRGRRALKLLIPLGLALGLAGGATFAAFSATTFNGDSITADPDWTAPSASGSVIMRNGGNVPGYIRQGAQYYVYAAITDSGNPPSGVASVTADVSSVTTGQTAAPLAAGSWTVDGIVYNYRSALLTATNPLAAGAKVYSLTMTDIRANSATQGGFVVTVDNTRPTGLDIQTEGIGFADGHAETADTITFTFSETMDPYTIMAGWDGSATSVTVRISNNIFADTLSIRNGNRTLPFGTISLAGNYVTNTVNFTGSTMVQSGATITITLGIPDRPTRLRTETNPGTMRWTPSTTPMDLAGNACMNTAVNESGVADVEF